MFLGMDFFLSGFKKYFNIIFIIVILAIGISLYAYIYYLRLENSSVQTKLDDLKAKYQITQKQLEYQKKLNDYYERNAEIASYTKEKIIENHHHYINNAEETKKIIDEFNKSNKEVIDILKVLNKLNQKLEAIK